MLKEEYKPVIPVLQRPRQRQKDCREFRVSLHYLVCTRIASVI